MTISKSTSARTAKPRRAAESKSAKTTKASKSRQRRKYFAKNFDAELWNREALAAALELSRDPNATTKERSDALKTYAQLLKAIDTSAPPADDKPFAALSGFLDEIRANASEARTS